MINSIVLVGRTTAEPSLAYTPNGKATSKFTIACDRRFKNQQGEREADFINVEVWGAQAEACANYLGKGKLAGVKGELRVDKYEKDGQTRYKTYVNAETVRFLSPKDSNNDFGGHEIDFDDNPFN